MCSYKPKLRFLFSGRRKKLYFFLLFAVGLLLGIAFAYSLPDVFGGIDYTAFFVFPSYFYLLIVNLIPILILFLFLNYSLDALCYPFVFLMGISEGFCGMGLYYWFGDSAWLIRIFLLFSHSLTAVLWWLLLLRNTGEQRSHIRKDACFFSFAILILSAIDCFAIAPLILDVYTMI